MHYAIPSQLVLDGRGTPWNTDLSAVDRATIREWYPSPRAASGTLHTGDDCDEIRFTLEYGVVDASSVAIALVPGENVTWWKGVSVPVGAGVYESLSSENGASDAILLTEAALDESQKIRFSKAKFLGEHTTLGFQWDAVPALVGGSRLTLTWVRDRC